MGSRTKGTEKDDWNVDRAVEDAPRQGRKADGEITRQLREQRRYCEGQGRVDVMQRNR